jgi:hypothetical protein
MFYGISTSTVDRMYMGADTDTIRFEWNRSHSDINRGQAVSLHSSYISCISEYSCEWDDSHMQGFTERKSSYSARTTCYKKVTPIPIIIGIFLSQIGIFIRYVPVMVDCIMRLTCFVSEIEPVGCFGWLECGTKSINSRVADRSYR